MFWLWGPANFADEAVFIACFDNAEGTKDYQHSVTTPIRSRAEDPVLDPGGIGTLYRDVDIKRDHCVAPTFAGEQQVVEPAVTVRHGRWEGAAWEPGGKGFAEPNPDAALRGWERVTVALEKLGPEVTIEARDQIDRGWVPSGQPVDLEQLRVTPPWRMEMGKFDQRGLRLRPPTALDLIAGLRRRSVFQYQHEVPGRGIP